ncbi:MAG: VOC family protein [bacterium]
MKIGVSFYYVGDIHKATRIYSSFLGTSPSSLDEDWVRFHLDGGDLALHLDTAIKETSSVEPVRFGAVVSITVDDITTSLNRACEAGFTQVGEVQHQAYGDQAQIRDPWGNRLSILARKP